MNQSKVLAAHLVLLIAFGASTKGVYGASLHSSLQLLERACEQVADS